MSKGDSFELECNPDDLAPGDRGSSMAFDWTGLRAGRLVAARDSSFDTAYARLWSEFGAKGEMEERQVIERRLAWDPTQAIPGAPDFSVAYELIAIFRGNTLVATRDHTAIVQRGARPQAVVHLSHVWVAPEYRGTGLIGWLRAWPILKAKQSLRAAGLPESSPITLVAEMEPQDSAVPETMARLKSYGRAGFLMADPRGVNYLQPDFRSPAAIDASGGPSPLPLRLVMRRVGLERQTSMSGAELASVIEALYRMYGASFRASDMEVLWAHHRQSGLANRAQITLINPLNPMEATS